MEVHTKIQRLAKVWCITGDKIFFFCVSVWWCRLAHSIYLHDWFGMFCVLLFFVPVVVQSAAVTGTQTTRFLTRNEQQYILFERTTPSGSSGPGAIAFF